MWGQVFVIVGIVMCVCVAALLWQVLDDLTVDD